MYGQFGNGFFENSNTPSETVNSLDNIKSLTVDSSVVASSTTSSTQLKFTTPSHAPGEVQITILSKDGDTTTTNYTYTDTMPPVITFTNGETWGYDSTINKGDTFDLRAQIASAVDDIDGPLNINDVQITSSPAFDSNQFGTYSIRYEITDKSGNPTAAFATIRVPGVGYNTTITNNTLPQLKGTIGADSPASVQGYIVPAGTAFDPANPGTVKPRFLSYDERSNSWKIITNQQEARLVQTKLAEREFVEYMIGNSRINDGATAAEQVTTSSTPQEVMDRCSSAIVQAYLFTPDEAACRSYMQDRLDLYTRIYLDEFDNTFVPANDWSPLAEGKYDVYFYEQWQPLSARFPAGLVIDTTKPQLTVTTPTDPKIGDFSPALTGTVDDPGATVIVTVDGKSYTALNNKDGTWVLAAGTISPLSPGEHTVVVTVTDTAGNTDSTTTKLQVLGASTENNSIISKLADTGQSLLLSSFGAVLLIVLAWRVVVKRKKSYTLAR